jgi:hypothetical protein
MVTARADAAELGAAYSPRPGAIWAEVTPALTWHAASAAFGGAPFDVSPGECPSAVASGMAGTFDWSKDYSLAWGSEFLANWSSALAAFKAASAIKDPAAASLRPGPRAAGVVLGRAPGAAASGGPAASRAFNFLGMAFPRAAAMKGAPSGKAGPNGARGYYGRGGSCSCASSCGYSELQTYNYVYTFDDYCDAGNNQWGPQTGNDMWGSTYNGGYCVGDATFGLVGNNQYDQCGRWCAIRCPSRYGEWCCWRRAHLGELRTLPPRPRTQCSPAAAASVLTAPPPPHAVPDAAGGVSAYVSPNYRFYGATNYYPNLVYASLPEDARSEVDAPSEARASVAAAAASPSAAPTRPMLAAACAGAAELSAALARSGSIDAGAGLGLAFPAVAVAPNGGAVVAALSSGPGRAPDGRADAYPGVAAAFLATGSSGATPLATLARAAGPLGAAGVVGGGPGYFGELTAADVHPVTGAVYVASRRGGAARAGPAFVPTWVGLIPMAAAAA